MENFEGFNDVDLGWLKKVNIDLDLGYDEDLELMLEEIIEELKEELWEGIYENHILEN
jgi:hypothetical protein